MAELPRAGARPLRHAHAPQTLALRLFRTCKTAWGLPPPCRGSVRAASKLPGPDLGLLAHPPVADWGPRRPERVFTYGQPTQPGRHPPLDSFDWVLG